MTDIEIPDIARTDRVDLREASTALIVVDMQNDFAHPDGALFCEEAPETFDPIRSLIDRAHGAGVPVIYTQDWHAEGDPEFDIWGEHVKAGTWGAEIVEELAPADTDTVIRKPRYDAFYATGLDHALRVQGITHVVIAGTVANICVLHTAGSAALRWYDVVVPEDAVSALNRFDKLAALRQIDFLFAGDITQSDGVVFS